MKPPSDIHACVCFALCEINSVTSLIERLDGNLQSAFSAEWILLLIEILWNGASLCFYVNYGFPAILTKVLVQFFYLILRPLQTCGRAQFKVLADRKPSTGMVLFKRTLQSNEEQEEENDKNKAVEKCV